MTSMRLSIRRSPQLLDSTGILLPISGMQSLLDSFNAELSLTMRGNNVEECLPILAPGLSSSHERDLHGLIVAHNSSVS